MSKMSELSQVLDELITCGEKMIQVAQEIKAVFSEENQTPEKKTKSKETPKKETSPAPAKETPAVSKEEVRAILAAKANEAGGQHKAQVKALVKKYGNGGSLADVPAESYPALLKEVEGLADA